MGWGSGLTLCCPQEAEGGPFVGVEADYYGLGGSRANPLLPIEGRRGAFQRGAGDYYGLEGAGLTLCCP